MKNRRNDNGRQDGASGRKPGRLRRLLDWLARGAEKDQGAPGRCSS